MLTLKPQNLFKVAFGIKQNLLTPTMFIEYYWKENLFRSSDIKDYYFI